MTSQTKTRYVYEILARHNGKPAGFCGRYRTKDAAHAAQASRRCSTVVKRVAICATEFRLWADSGFKPMGFG